MFKMADETYNKKEMQRHEELEQSNHRLLQMRQLTLPFGTSEILRKNSSFLLKKEIDKPGELDLPT